MFNKYARVFKSFINTLTISTTFQKYLRAFKSNIKKFGDNQWDMIDGFPKAILRWVKS